MGGSRLGRFFFLGVARGHSSVGPPSVSFCGVKAVSYCFFFFFGVTSLRNG